MFKVSLLWIIALISVPVLSVERAVFVVGGSNASIQDAPWQAFLVANNRFCGAVIIDAQWALTAAHCVDTADKNSAFSLISPNLLSVYSGTNVVYEFDFNQHLSLVDAVYVHHAYNKKSLENDIALLKLSTNIHSTAAAILMADERVQADVDATGNLGNNDLLLTGWGATQADRTGFQRTLQKATLSTVSDSSCASSWGGPVWNVPDYQNKYLCAQKTGIGACNGDSGSPLVWFDPSRASDPDRGATLVGIVSFGVNIECSSPYYPDVYTQVSNYQEWIKKCQNGTCSAPSALNGSGGGGSLGVYFGLFIGLILFKRRLSLLSASGKRLKE